MLQMMARIASLERDCNMFRNHVAISSNDNEGYAPDQDTSSPSGSTSSATSLPESEAFHGATCLYTPIQILNRTVACDEDEQPDPSIPSPEESFSSATSVYWLNLPPAGNKTFEALEKETRLKDLAPLRHSIDVFFSHLNQHYPCLNENQFRAQFDSFVANDSTQLGNADRPQFIALINLIQAEVSLLGDDWSSSSSVPAWEEFCRAESILNRLIWLGNGNILTIQCLLIKARYLLYIEKSDGAYDTMGRVVRLAFQLGLHDQPSWVGCTPFEVTMRQRIFWTIFYLERNIAFNNGAPYLIRESDFRVDLPPNLEDKRMFPDMPLPEETPERSYGPYLSGAVKWGRLCAEIWDTMFATSAQKPASPEFIASMDARILYTVGQLPPHLQWHRNLHRLNGGGGNPGLPLYVLRQTIILHLRFNQLRMILRQESILGSRYSEATADECVSIATSTIEALHAHHACQLHKPTGRFSSVLYLVGALLPLVCIIVKRDNKKSTRAQAIDSFKKGLTIFNGMYSNYTVARHTLRRLHRIIETAKRAILNFHNSESLTIDPKDVPPTDALVPQMSDFFGHDQRNGADEDVLNQLLNGFQNGFHNLDTDIRNTAEEMDAFWVDDDLRRLFEMGALEN
ncbi:hypothetical protein K432DRAFT_177297 [Lepidopterella palustris CBS 459.81]|uniref:Xylanolytic transcriptional activator regulatory domain-containing protein n=1 Tax=Lepidopterella palustris CBS 459.81 TaxID=1314670 RepID=A0A8E2E0M8_9PEZI|nr:hypothetical protein K432DRAFT_177297 [Lepidopterella palustris CBS 459.81]